MGRREGRAPQGDSRRVLSVALLGVRMLKVVANKTAKRGEGPTGGEGTV